MSIHEPQTFAEAIMRLDGVTVGLEEGRFLAKRDLADDQVSLEKLFETAYEWDLRPADAIIDIQNAETRVVFEGFGDGSGADEGGESE